MKKYYLTIDLGASNGRGIVFEYDGEKILPVYVSRFKNGIETRGSTDYWDFAYLLQNVKNVLKETAEKYPLQSFAIDSWGLDFGLLDDNCNLLDDPVSYRDGRTIGVPEKLFKKIPKRELYELTGTQCLQGNTIFQLYSMLLSGSPLLPRAKHLLMIPDLLTYYFTGEKHTEYSIASTTQLMDITSRKWSKELFNGLSLPGGLLRDIVYPGAQAYSLTESIKRELGIGDIPLVTAASHDTASAVIAVPAQEGDCLYVSSGTWSVIGTELEQPLICDEGFFGNFTNEGGFGGSIRYCRSLVGLWLIQECVRVWRERGVDVSFSQLDELARDGRAFKSFFDPQSPEVSLKCDMPAEISALCQNNGSEAPQSMGDFARCIYECMAFNYRRTIENLEKQTNKSFKQLYIVGGGTHADFLNRCVANATGKTVVAGISEATAFGNAFSQLYYAGELSSVSEFRALLRKNEKVSYYEPTDFNLWDEQYKRFLEGAGC